MLKLNISKNCIPNLVLTFILDIKETACEGVSQNDIFK